MEPSGYLRKTWKNPKGVPRMALPDLAVVEHPLWRYNIHKSWLDICRKKGDVHD